MLRRMSAVLVIAVIAGLLYFGGIASTAAGTAKILFFILLAVFIAVLAIGWARRLGPPF